MLSIVLPTYNEAANLPEVLAGIARAVGHQDYEVIVVDDNSPDRTWEVAEHMSRRYPLLTVIRRIGRRGLSSAVTEGCARARGDMIIVMDADLQHDPAIITQLVKAISDGADIAVASRYMQGGGVGGWVTGRRIISKTATLLARAIPPVKVSDPMSGFFAIRTTAYQHVAPHLRPSGFKILLEILAFLPRATVVAEVPLVFKMRTHGESKLSLRVELLFLWQLVRILLHRLQWPLFLLVVLASFAIMLPRVWNLSLLYTNPLVRSQVQHTLATVAANQGWLVSDVSVREIDSQEMKVVHRAHHRGQDEQECFILSYNYFSATPCVD